MAHELTELERESAEPIPDADELAGGFELVVSDHLKSDADYQAQMSNLGFGVDYSDYMAHATWHADGGWTRKVIEPYGPLALDPGTAVLHYGQEIFEGLKAYRHDDGSIWTFRPLYNSARLNRSGRRLAIPALPARDFMESIVGLVRADARWVPQQEGASLYLRPFTFASESFLGVRAASRYEYLVMASPSGPYFEHGFQPIEVWVEKTYHRAGPGGMGDAKTGGNYASSLLPKVTAHDEGFDEVMFLDARTATTIDELGGMNVFVVMSDGSVKTPALNGNILPGCTRSSIIQLLESEGVSVSEVPIAIADVVAGLKNGTVTEMFACGTAAVVTAIGRLASDDFDVTVPAGPMTKRIYDEITNIQLGRAEDKFGWCYRLA
ncbi:MAG: branched-chain amino acid aminotransferase [Actinomycetaceae bacterium]|nr:branched-chain amino acid aminotransferase [Arcanobacterium sp.]MDD7686953.1 branched-chain amino acid aminotransferase [Actinomycetaceae bacterium]MDY5273392.1 branched-chain amino acid aminotransferase [Arcanobacterium sp.]